MKASLIIVYKIENGNMPQYLRSLLTRCGELNNVNVTSWNNFERIIFEKLYLQKEYLFYNFLNNIKKAPYADVFGAKFCLVYSF